MGETAFYLATISAMFVLAVLEIVNSAAVPMI